VAGRIVDVLEAVEIEQQQRRRLAFGDEVLEQRIAAIEKRAPLGTPVSGSVSAASRCSSSARSFDMATRRNGRQKAINNASNAITVATAPCAWPLLTEAAKSCA
jgi:hypothetical protein